MNTLSPFVTENNQPYNAFREGIASRTPQETPETAPEISSLGNYFSKTARLFVLASLVSSSLEAKSIEVRSGWNLIAPVISEPMSIDAYADSVDLNKEIIKRVWGYDINGWKSSPGTLTQLEPGKGYWFYLSASDTLEVDDTVQNPERPYRSGWNLQGNSSSSDVNMGDMVASAENPDSIKRMWKYDESGWSSNLSQNINGAGGFWLYASEEGKLPGIVTGNGDSLSWDEVYDLLPPTCPGCPMSAE